jgi:hypothetical protein
MTVTPGDASDRFDAAVLAGLDEPVRRYFTHALTDGAPLARRARLRLGGAIKVGVWLRFDSVWEGDGRGFSWRATCGPGPLRLLRVHDQFADGVGIMDIRLRAPLRLPGTSSPPGTCRRSGRSCASPSGRTAA